MYSSEFKDFLKGDVVAEYAYTLLINAELLESASGEMPKSATSSSDASGTDCSSVPVRPRVGGSSKSPDPDLIEALKAPVEIQRTSAQSKKEYYDAEVSKLKYKTGLDATLSAKETALAELCQAMDKYGEGKVPQGMVKRKERLEKEIDALDAQAMLPSPKFAKVASGGKVKLEESGGKVQLEEAQD